MISRTLAISLVALAAGCAIGGDGDGTGATPSASKRTVITRPLAPTSASNLLVDPFIGGESEQYAQFIAFYNDANEGDVAMTRTFQSQSPIGGALSIEEIRNAAVPTGATDATVMAFFLGGGGSFHASLWLSIGDAQADPVAFTTASTAVTVALFASDGTGKATLAPGPVVTYNKRQWVQYATTSDVALPTGGWFSIQLTDLTKTLQLAAPEVTSTTLGGPAVAVAALEPLAEVERTALVHAAALHRDRPPLRRHRELPAR